MNGKRLSGCAVKRTFRRLEARSGLVCSMACLPTKVVKYVLRKFSGHLEQRHGSSRRHMGYHGQSGRRVAGVP
jgi:hypothetical protein